MVSKLYVGNLSFQSSEGELESTFGEFGEVKSVKIITDRDTGKSRGFAFVEMGTEEEAEAAIAALNGKEVGGRTLRVNIARDREPGGGGRGGRDGGGRDGGGFNRKRW